MIYTELTRNAMRIAYKAHDGQVDKGNVPYVFHPFTVASSMETEVETAAALLHDVLEDTDITEEDLRREGITEEVIAIVKIVTRDIRIPYNEYIGSIIDSGCITAMKVKLSDLTHNSDETRVEGGLSEKLRKRYSEAKMRIENELKSRENP